MGGSASSLLDENKSKYIKGKKKLNNRESLRLKFWYALGERRNEGAAHFIEHRWREWAVSVGFRATFHITVFGVEALEAVSLRINIRSAILIWIVMPVWAFFTWKCELEWETVPVDFPESRVSGYSQSCPSGYAWLSLTRHFVPLPISSLEGGRGTLYMYFSWQKH